MLPLPTEDEIQKAMNRLRNMPQYRNWTDAELREKAETVLTKKSKKKEDKTKVKEFEKKVQHERRQKEKGKESELLGFRVDNLWVMIRDDAERTIVASEFEKLKEAIPEWEKFSSTIAPYLNVMLVMNRLSFEGKIGSIEYKNLGDQLRQYRIELNIDRKTTKTDAELSGREEYEKMAQKAQEEIESYKDCFFWLCGHCGKMNLMEAPHFLFSSWCEKGHDAEACSKCKHREECGKTIWNQKLFEGIRDGDVSIFFVADIFQTSIFNLIYLAAKHEFDLGPGFNFNFNDQEKMKEMVFRELAKWNISEGRAKKILGEKFKK